MAHVVKDRVMETTASTGTGTITLDGAAAGYQDFSVIGNANTTYYTISGGTEWEVGIGTYTSSGTTLSRDTVLESSNAGAKVSFSAGTKNVFVTYPAERSVSFESGTTMLFVQSTAPTGWTKSTTHDNKALRVVSGTAGTGGSVNFTTAFSSKTPSGSVSTSITAISGSVGVSGTVGSTTLTESQIPSHRHNVVVDGLASMRQQSGGSVSGYGYTDVGAIKAYQRSVSADNTGGGGSHNHSFSGSGSFTFSSGSASSSFTGSSIDLNVQYVDVIIATKD